MDHRRLDTGQAGISDLPVPETDVPEEREDLTIDGDCVPGPGALADVIEAGKLVRCPEYYGIAYAWKQDGSYRGVLLQYRTVTENPTFKTCAELVQWLTDIVPAIAG
jgi:hypothetical protein